VGVAGRVCGYARRVEGRLIALKKGSSRITGVRALGFRAGHFSHLAPRTSRMARLRPRGLGFAVASYTWASCGETLVPTLAAQTRPPRSKRKAAHAAHVLNWPTAAPLVRNSPRGWTPRSLTTRRSAGRRAVGRGCCHRSRLSRQSCWYDHSGSVSAFLAAALPRADDLNGSSGVERLAMAIVTSRQPERRCFAGSIHTNLRNGKSLRCPPSRRVPHKWSGRRPIRTWSAQRTFRYETRRTCLSSEGGHRRLCAATSARRRLCASPFHSSGGASR
jgi:hypothetical protein